MSFRWRKRGLILTAEAQFPWMLHHASVPTALALDNKTIRIWFGPRDSAGQTHVAVVDVDAQDLSLIRKLHDTPALSPGVLGGFDDDGVMPCHVVHFGGVLRMYYVGWNRGVTVSYRNAIGVAESVDGLQFEKVFPGPIVDRCATEPFFTATPFVRKEEGRWRMWYASCTGWEVWQDRPEPRYAIMPAESDDGLVWQRTGQACLAQVMDGEASSRPTIWHDGGSYHMWFCFRGNRNYRTDHSQAYRLGYATSADGIEWVRQDKASGLERSAEGWDSEMMAYPFVFEAGGRLVMLYVGNGFGRSGFGWAEAV